MDARRTALESGRRDRTAAAQSENRSGHGCGAGFTPAAGFGGRHVLTGTMLAHARLLATSSAAREGIVIANTIWPKCTPAEIGARHEEAHDSREPRRHERD